MHHLPYIISFTYLYLAIVLCAYVILQEPFQGIDADDGSMFETEFSPTSKGDNNTDLSWTSTPVSHLLAQIK